MYLFDDLSEPVNFVFDNNICMTMLSRSFEWRHFNDTYVVQFLEKVDCVLAANRSRHAKNTICIAVNSFHLLFLNQKINF